MEEIRGRLVAEDGALDDATWTRRRALARRREER